MGSLAKHTFDTTTIWEGDSRLGDKHNTQIRGFVTAEKRVRGEDWDDGVAARVVDMFATNYAACSESLTLCFQCIQAAGMTPHRKRTVAQHVMEAHARRNGVAMTLVAIRKPECQVIVKRDTVLAVATSGFSVNTSPDRRDQMGDAQRKAAKRKAELVGKIRQRRAAAAAAVAAVKPKAVKRKGSGSGLAGRGKRGRRGD